MARSLSFFYFTYFAGLGVILPYFNLYFETLGMSPFQIGFLAAGSLLFAMADGPRLALVSAGLFAAMARISGVVPAGAIRER